MSFGTPRSGCWNKAYNDFRSHFGGMSGPRKDEAIRVKNNRRRCCAYGTSLANLFYANF
jgi:hypothetical protein